MKQYNVVVRFYGKSKLVCSKRNAVPKDLENNGKHLLDKEPILRPNVPNCMDLMKATALKAGLIKLGFEHVAIEELSAQDYRNLETYNNVAQAGTLLKYQMPFVKISANI